MLALTVDLLKISSYHIIRMSIRKILVLILLLFSVSLLVPKASHAVSLQEMLTSENSVITKVQEGIEYFFAFKVENKVQVLERQAEKRLTLAQSYAEDGNNARVQSVMQSYLQIKEKQNDLLGKNTSEDVLGAVEERTIEQQKTMEEIKTKTGEDVKQNIIQVQEKVVNQVAQRIIEVNGPQGQTEFFNKVEHVWAPGTGPGGGEAGVVIEGGAMQFAPGTSGGGPAGSDIKTVEVKTGGVSNEASVNNSDSNLAPGTIQGGGGGNTIDAGGVDSGNTPDSQTWIAP